MNSLLEMKLSQILEQSEFQKLQDEIAFATKLSMVTVDYRGKPVTKHSNCSTFCKAVRDKNDLCGFCEKCDARGGLEAAQLKKPYIYICHMGVIDFAIPIIFNGIYLGAILGGQVLVSGSNHTKLNPVLANVSSNIARYPDLLASYTSLEVMPYERIEALANMVSYISNYVIREAIQKINDEVGVSPIKNKESISNSKAMHTLEPAIQYMNENYSKEINLSHLASLCNISPTYFSKLFTKIYNQNIASYVNFIRCNKAKILLITTNRTVVNIAYEVGFQDCGYFIKIFKKIENITPHQFRENSDNY